MQQQHTSSQPAILEILNAALRKRHIKATAAVDALSRQAEQVLALCEEHPHDQSLHQLLESVREQLVARHEERQATAVHITK